MSTTFQINVSASPEMLRNPPAQFAHTGLVYCGIDVQVGPVTFPSDPWYDLAGVLLLDWCREVWQLSAEESRAARMVFTETPKAIWLRRTSTRRWKASCMTWSGKQKTPLHEALIIPEQVEAALLSASRRLLTLVRGAGVWWEDCQALEDFLAKQARQSYGHGIA